MQRRVPALESCNFLLEGKTRFGSEYSAAGASPTAPRLGCAATSAPRGGAAAGGRDVPAAGWPEPGGAAWPPRGGGPGCGGRFGIRVGAAWGSEEEDGPRPNEYIPAF